MNKKTVADVDVKGKKVLVRVDFNVPLNENKEITDDSRIIAALPTINYLLGHGAAVILLSHLGRPKGQVKEEFRLKPVAQRLQELLETKVFYLEDCIGEEVKKQANELQPGQVMLLENLRFYPEEEANDSAFASKLASLADIYVNDAFGTAHRAHASTTGIAQYLPAVSGFLLNKEIKAMDTALAGAEHPFTAIMGGSKVSDKIGVIKNLLNKVDSLLIGGGMANTFLLAQGYNMQKSFVEKDNLDWAQTLLAQEEADKIKLPVDVVVTDHLAEDAPYRVVSVDAIPENWMAVDIGPRTVAIYAEIIRQSKTVVWNGPMGVFEIDNFAAGTEGVARAIGETDCLSIVGGGDSLAAIHKLGVEEQISHISTGGGASLKMLEGSTLPGVAALLDKKTGKEIARRPIIAGNWKMHKTPLEAKENIAALRTMVSGSEAEIIIFPPFIDIPIVASEAAGSNIYWGGQNMYWRASGAFTGEISAPMLIAAGCRYVLCGHSERRQFFGDTDQEVGRKAVAAFAHGLIPMVCVGETLAQRQAEETHSVLCKQIRECLSAIDRAHAARLLIAYEPIWAIGTGVAAKAQDAQEAACYIRKQLVRMWDKDTANSIRILYGGSVKPHNIQELMACEDIDGVLVGGSSLDAATFADMANSYR